ncbi:uroporphyrinogen-III synthase [Teredinibacter purpureus]|uniref:uroporphyrinogen-III synthase n=1 Tax=Teredinibacter purpureus TaxID=2731756 RepID=UPI000697EB64|nr:uroporphyrinogen-III synthase [Teredinibacter purpureus]
MIATRPLAQNTSWCARLESEGFATLGLPLLAISAVGDKAQQNAVKQKIMNFDQYNAVIFVSQNAVDHTYTWLDQYWPQFPEGIQYFAVGAKTAERAQACLGRGLTDIAIAKNTMTSEELLQHALLLDVKQQKILICRGVGGRGKLAEVLQQRGAIVDYCELYHRQIPATAYSELERAALTENDVISIFSGETLKHLIQLADASSDRHLREKIRTLPLLLPSKRVADDAAAAGFHYCLVSPNASESKMLETLLKEFPEIHS